MKRFHVNVSVSNLEKSRQFYETLFGEAATVSKPDYAKWMLEDPKVNFSITESRAVHGINHVGLQVESSEELGEIQARLDRAEQQTFRQEQAECCYARSSKTWARDPDDVAWETFVTHDDLPHFGGDHAPSPAETASPDKATRCCA